MKPTRIATESKFYERFEELNIEASKLAKGIYEKVVSDLDSKIIATLVKKGFIFESEEERNEFAKTRCLVFIGPSEVSTLLVGEMPICQWKENTSMDFDPFQKNDTLTVIHPFFKEL